MRVESLFSTGFFIWACRLVPRLCLRALGLGRGLTGKGRRAVAVALGLSWMLALGIVSDQIRRGRGLQKPSEEERRRVYSLEWEAIAPEITPVIDALRACGREVRETFDGMQVHQLYACDSDEGPFSDECVREAQQRLHEIEQPADYSLRWYQRNAEARAKRSSHSAACTPASAVPRLRPEKTRFVGGQHGAGAANASVWVSDFSPCGAGQDRFIVYLRHNASLAAAAAAAAPSPLLPRGGGHSAQDQEGPVVGQLGGLAARVRLDHLAYSKARGAGGGVARCSERVQDEVMPVGSAQRRRRTFAVTAPAFE